MSHHTNAVGARTPAGQAPGPQIDGYLSPVQLRESAQRLDYLASLVAAGVAPEGTPDLAPDVLSDWARSLRALIPAAAAAEREGAPGVPYADAEFYELGMTLEQLQTVVRREPTAGAASGEPFAEDGWGNGRPHSESPRIDERFELAESGVRLRRG